MAAAFNDIVAREIREALLERHRSQSDLAAALGWTDNYLSRRLRGEVGFSLADVEQIALALDLSRSQLLGASLPKQVKARRAG
jgi:transcriptional regulator with XRE-family HTH domain